MKPKVIVTISKLGLPTFDVEGGVDAGCKSLTKPFLDALAPAGEGVQEVEKPEASVPAGTGSVSVGGGW